MTANIQVSGIPKDAEEVSAALLRSRLLSAYQDFADKSGSVPDIRIAPADLPSVRSKAEPPDDGVKTFELTREPLYTFEQLILPDETRDAILQAIQVLSVEEIVFDQWGLRKIEPYPKTALNFYGPPGTGKTLAAHAIARFLHKKILIASYAEIESKYHGDGPKNVKKIFQDAEKNNAVLFIDEADSLLSKRLTNVSQGSEQAINSMRSQLLICLEQFHGVVIFATNLIKNYDKAFETRIQHIEFLLPDRECRKKIWEQHLPSSLPLAPDVSLDALSEIGDLCGRDIRNAVIQSAVRAALDKRTVNLNDLQTSAEKIKIKRISPEKDTQQPLTEEERKLFLKKAHKAVKKIKQRRKK